MKHTISKLYAGYDRHGNIIDTYWAWADKEADHIIRAHTPGITVVRRIR